MRHSLNIFPCKLKILPVVKSKITKQDEIYLSLGKFTNTYLNAFQKVNKSTFYSVCSRCTERVQTEPQWHKGYFESETFDRRLERTIALESHFCTKKKEGTKKGVKERTKERRKKHCQGWACSLVYKNTCLTCMKPWIPSLALYKPGMVASACSSSTQEAELELEGSEVQIFSFTTLQV